MRREEPDDPDRVDGPDAAWAAVRAAEPGGMCRDELAVLLANVKRVRACLDAVELRAARRARELAAVGESEPAESLPAGEGGHDSRDAAAIGERDQVCDDLPDVESALDDGGLTAAHVDAIAVARKRLPERLRAEFDAVVTVTCSTKAAPGAPPTGPNAGRYGQCTAAARPPTVTSGSRRVASITSAGGGATPDPPTSTTSYPSVNGITTSSTKAAGPSP